MYVKSRREGFALPLALFVIAFVTVGVAASFTRVENEQRVNRDRDAAVDAFSIAESGLQYFLMNRKTLGFTSVPPAVSESARVNLTGGYADVILTQVRPVTGYTVDALYLIRSRGTVTQGSSTATPPAQHTVSQYALYRRGTMEVRAAWTSLTGLTKNGGSGSIDGTDECAVAPDVAGVAVPDASYLQNGGAPVPTGTPPIDYLGPPATADDSIHIDWNGIVNQNLIPPDLTIPTDTWPSFTDPNYWPVIRVDGSYSIPTSGRGVLIATGDLTIAGSLSWSGVLLVGGVLTANGNNQVRGAVISGLNVKLGMVVAMSDVGNGNKTYQYNSCNVSDALNGLGNLRVIPGTWNDNWSW